MAQASGRGWWGACALGAVAAALIWSGPEHASPPMPSNERALPMAAAAAAALASHPPAANRPASSPPADPTAAPTRRPSRADPTLALAQFEAQWCSAGRQAHQQQMASLEQSFGPQRRMAMHKAAASLPFHRFQFEVQRRVVAGWVATLARSADPRDQATALFLRASQAYLLQEVDADPARAFQALAANTADPYVLHLWRRHDPMCLRGDGCQQLPLSRWSQIDPDNAAAWLPVDPFKPTMTEAQWQGLAQARTYRVYHLELQARLLALVRHTPPGLELEVALNHIARFNDLESLGLTLEIVCKQPGLLATQQASCLRVAELVWSQDRPSVVDRDMAVLVAKRLGDLDARWQARADEVRPLNDLDYEDLRTTLRGPPDEAPDCSGLAARRQHLLDQAQAGSWAVLARRLAARDPKSPP